MHRLRSTKLLQTRPTIVEPQTKTQYFDTYFIGDKINIFAKYCNESLTNSKKISQQLNLS